jgi:hypothetical protein
VRVFPTAFSAQKNMLTGASPVWIFKFAAGGVDYYLSDNAFLIGPWSKMTLPWMQSLGKVQAGIPGMLDSYKVDNFELSILIDTSVTPNMETLVTNYPLESSPVSLYLWFIGCTDPPQEVFRGYIEDPSMPDETTVQLVLQDESLRLERAMIGERVTRVSYPNADPDDINKIIPIPLGPTSRLPAIAVNAGRQTTLPAGISATATSFTLTDGLGFAINDIIQIDFEQIKVLGLSGDSVTSCTRGWASTTAQVHQQAAIAWQRRTSFDYIVSAFPLASIAKVRALLGGAEVDITPICTRYTGQVGSVHPAYPGKAVVTIPGYVTAAQAVTLLATGGLTTAQATDVVNALGISNGLTVSTVVAISGALHTHVGVLGVIALSLDTYFYAAGDVDGTGLLNACDGNKSTFTTIRPTGQASYYRTQQQIGLGTPTRIRAGVLSTGQGGSNQTTYMHINNVEYPHHFTYPMAALYVTYTDWQTFTDWSIFDLGPTGNNRSCYVTVRSENALTIKVYDIWWEVEYDPTAAQAVASVNVVGDDAGVGTSIAIAGTLPLATAIAGNPVISGNSVANTLVGSQILCDCMTLSSSISSAFDYLLSEAGYPGVFNLVGVWPSCYALSGAITEYRSAIYWLNDLAFQVRAWFKLSPGRANLIFRDGSLISDKTLPTCRISDGKRVHSRHKTAYDDILNRVSIAYARDWSKPAGADAYQAAVDTGPDSDSVDDYGARERPELFQFDFVTDDEMAADAQQFYLGWYKDRHWLHEFESFLYDCELEFGDVVTLGFAGNVIGSVLEVQSAPGDCMKSDLIGLMVVV